MKSISVTESLLGGTQHSVSGALAKNLEDSFTYFTDKESEA